MKLKQLLSWRFSLIFFHRWLGIVIGLMFVIWSLSGVALLYYGIPHFQAGERLDRLPPLDLSTVTVSPAQALERVDGRPFRLRISMQNNRPVYRINTGFVFGNWTPVFADTGEVFQAMDEDAALAWLAANYPDYANSMSYESMLTAPDMFTHSPALQNYMPMHRIALGDAANTKYYISANSAEIVMKTDRTTRFMGFMGYNLHTLFFFRQAGWWTPFLHWVSWLGLAMATLGIVLGIWRFSLKPANIRRGIAYRTPYSGWFLWHHYLGLGFGFMMIIWVFSGLVSMSQIPGIKETPYTPTQIQAGAKTLQGFGAYTDYEPLTIPGMQHSLAKLNATFPENLPVKELELLYFNDLPYYIAYRPPTADELLNWESRSALNFNNATLDHDHNFISANQLNAEPFSDFSEAALLIAAERAMPEASIVEQSWLTEFDDYYYYPLSSFDLGLPRAVKTLPVLRLKYDDAERTWLYMSPSHAQILKLESPDRRNRWGYYGLHSLDFAFLYNNRPLWDIVLLILLVGALGLSITTLVPMFRRLKRHFLRLSGLDKASKPVK